MADGNIFISYRRGLDSNAAGRLYDRLERHFDRAHLYFDIDSIPLGVDFAEHIDRQVGKCDVLLVIIGPGWLRQKDRLFKPDDFVRIEIEAALKRSDLPVIPVLFEGAQMPAREDLPESIRPLLGRNKIELRHTQFAQLVDGRLAPALRELVSVLHEPKEGAITDPTSESIVGTDLDRAEWHRNQAPQNLDTDAQDTKPAAANLTTAQRGSRINPARVASALWTNRFVVSVGLAAVCAFLLYVSQPTTGAEEATEWPAYIFAGLIAFMIFSALFSIIGSDASNVSKLLWSLFVLFMPIIGYAAWVVAGPRSKDAKLRS